MNKIDPTGLYEEDVHYYMTYFLALTAGLSDKQALIIATADRYIDDNPFTEPYGSMGTNFSARAYYHFTQDGWDKTKDAAMRFLNPENPQINALHEFATSDHGIGWDHAPSNCAKLQMYGEFLHAYEDTYAHRDADNVPYSTIGHVSGGHNPDFTYNHIDALGRDWKFNEARTIAMEKATFNFFKQDYQLEAKSNKGIAITFKNIESTLTAFNQSQTSETAKNIEEKKQILDKFLEANGFNDIPVYDCNKGRDFRNQNLVDVNGTPLNQSDYIGTIFKTPKSNEACK